MTREQNLATFEKWVSAHQKHDVQKLLQVVDEDIEISSAGMTDATGKQEAEKHWSGIYQAFPDMLLEPVTVTADGERIVAEADFGGTLKGAFKGNEPTGKYFKTRGVFILDFKNGNIEAITTYYDVRHMMGQLGLKPPA